MCLRRVSGLLPFLFWVPVLAAEDLDSRLVGNGIPSRVPLGLSVLIPVPPDNPITGAKVALGKQLFFDTGLSRDGSVSCGTCHQVKRAYADGRSLALGVHGRQGRRNAPSLHNVAYRRTLFWDGRRRSLEEQALDPIVNPLEMGNSVASVITYLENNARYRQLFEDAFDSRAISAKRVSQALASFERSLLSGDSAYDRYRMMGDRSALSRAAVRGLRLFKGQARCSHCHEPPLFTDDRFHNTGVSWDKQTPDRGRFEETHDERNQGEFRTPSLRDIFQTAPYMHDGSMETLDEVVEFYNQGGQANPFLDPTIQPLQLDAQQKRDLVAFLKSLSGKRSAIDSR